MRILILTVLMMTTPTLSGAAAPAPLRLQTEDTVLTAGLRDGLPVLLGLASRRSGSPAWLKAPSPVALIDHVTMNGQQQPLTWRCVKMDPRAVGAQYVLRSEPALLEARVGWRARSGPGPIEQSVTYTSLSKEPLALPLPQSLALALDAPPGASLENWWVEKGAGWASPAGTHREPVTAGYSFTQSSTPYGPEDTREMIPWMCVQDTAGGQGVYFGVESSARVSMTLNAGEGGRGLAVTAGLDPSDGEFSTVLAPGESFAAPVVFMGCYVGGVDDGANRLHRFVERHLRPAVSDKRYPLLVNNSWGSGMAVSDALCRRMIDDSAALGIEMFHVDAGWFQGVGDWHSDRTKLPGGLEAVADYAHGKGLLFGLWVGWTQGGVIDRGSETLTVNNPAERGWFTRDYPSTWKPSDFTGADVCLASRPAQEWCRAELARIVRSYHLDLLEHDQRMIVQRCERTDHGHTPHPTDVAFHAAEGYNAVYDRLRKQFPRLLFEDCVNGGRMVDFSVIQRVHYISIVDSYDPVQNRKAFYDTSFPLPPSMCECYVAQHPGPTLATFRAMIRSGMMGWCTIMCDMGNWSEAQKQAAKHQFDIYKTWLRPLINAGNLYHVTERPDGVRWDGVQYSDPKTGRGVLYAFRGTTDEGEHRFGLKGLDPVRTYRVWSEDGGAPEAHRTGRDLMADGVLVRLIEKESSDLVYLQAE